MKRKKSYPGVMYRWAHPPVEVDASDFMTQEEAAEELGISMLTIALYIPEGRVRAATLNGAPGVSRRSVEEEAERRTHAWYRLKAFLRSVFRLLP